MASIANVGQSSLDFAPVQPRITAPALDISSPAAVVDLSVVVQSADSLTLAWTAPGDNQQAGSRVLLYDIRMSYSPILSETDFDSAIRIPNPPMPQANPNSETFTVNGLPTGPAIYFALKSIDAYGNVSQLSNMASKSAVAFDATPPSRPILIDEGIHINAHSLKYQLVLNGFRVRDHRQ